jgi:hypothetical protein
LNTKKVFISLLPNYSIAVHATHNHTNISNINECSFFFLYSKFVRLVGWGSCTRKQHQIWIQVKEENRKVQESLDMLMTCYNLLSKYDNLNKNPCNFFSQPSPFFVAKLGNFAPKIKKHFSQSIFKDNFFILNTLDVII